ncbi:MAG: NAD(P)-binding domain-containing protein, partial [Saprospiraceae bacterium]|nr:NAD(P)-binding domain-containing protein [Saprospiraceae bacterium]
RGRVTKPLFDTLAIIGPGLIGSSIMRAAREHGAVRTIVTTSRSPETRQRVTDLAIADRVVETNAEAVQGADLVIVTSRHEPSPGAIRNNGVQPVGLHKQRNALC